MSPLLEKLAREAQQLDLVELDLLYNHLFRLSWHMKEKAKDELEKLLK